MKNSTVIVPVHHACPISRPMGSHYDPICMPILMEEMGISEKEAVEIEEEERRQWEIMEGEKREKAAEEEERRRHAAEWMEEEERATEEGRAGENHVVNPLWARTDIVNGTKGPVREHLIRVMERGDYIGARGQNPKERERQ